MAIAFDNVAAFTTSILGPFDNAYTVTGTNPFLLVGIRIRSTESAITGITYGGVSLGASIQDVTNMFSNVDFHLYYLKAPATGSNTLSVAYTGVPLSALNVQVLSYSGVDQTSPIDSSHSDKFTAQTTFTETTTVVASNCWLAGFCTNDSANMAAGTGTTLRDQTIPGEPSVDSNAIIGTGAQSLQTTVTPAGNGGFLVASIKPFTAVASTASPPSNLLTMNVG